MKNDRTMLSKNYIFIVLIVLLLFNTAFSAQEYDWKPQPRKAALMLIIAHPDDEEYFGGIIPYYAVVLKLPVVVICMTTSSSMPNRKDEMRRAIWKYGMRNEPIFADFPDCCYGKTLEENWKMWGGKDAAVSFLTSQIRKYKTDVIMTHAFDGEYGHPNHMACAYATAEAFIAASDSSKYKEQLDNLELWQPKKLYIHDYPNYGRITRHSWDMKFTELGGKSSLEVANEGLKCHKSQAKIVASGEELWGLYATTVGQDIIAKDNFFENIDLSIYFKQQMPTGNLGASRK